MTSDARPYSLRRRLTIAATVTFAALIAALSVMLWRTSADAANRSYDLILSGAAIAVSERLGLTPDGIEVDLPPAAFELLALASDDRVFYRIADSSGDTLTGDPGLPLAPRRGGEELAFSDADFAGDPVRVVTTWRVLPGPAGPVRVGVALAQTRLARQAMQEDLFLRGLLPLAALAVAGLVAARLGIDLAMRPLAGLEREIRGRVPTNLTPFGAVPPREVESLIDGLNDFMRRLGTSRDNAQVFIADVAHQMRTALAALAAHLEPRSDVSGEHLAEAREQVGRTVRLTNQLLSHAMVLHRGEAAQRERVDLGRVVRDLLEETVRSGAARDASFALEAEDAIGPVEGDAVALREALRNLLDNALKHGPPDNEIVIRLGAADLDGAPALALSVEDRGPGIPEAERGRVTERFYAAGPTGGSGVGLAIVAAVAVSHAGRLTLSDAPGSGLVATLVLPVVGAETVPPESPST